MLTTLFLLAFRGRELTTTPLIERFYKQNKYLPVWTTAMQPNHDGRELMRLFAKSAYYGLDTSFLPIYLFKGALLHFER